MRNNFSQPFTNQLKKSLAPVYLVSGDETLLVNECLDAIRDKAKKNGFLERERFNVERGFDWSDFIFHTEALSLFSDKTILELHCPNAKLDKAATEILIHYLKNPPPDKLLVMITNKLSPATKKTAWYKTLSEKGEVIALWPLNGSALLQFIQARFSQHGLKANPDATRLLAELTHGNLLATDQAIQKLALLLGHGEVTPEAIKQIVSDSSRFTIFDWSQFLLLGHTEKALHCLTVLRLTGTEPVLLLWLLSRELRILYQYHLTRQFKNEWPARQEQLKVAARRLPKTTLSALLQHAAQLDLTIKGLNTRNVWTALEEVTLKICHT